MIRLACASLSCDGFVDQQFRPTFTLLPKIGYNYVEFNCWHPSDLTARSVASIKRRLRETGLAPAAIYGSAFGAATPHDISKDVCHKLRMMEVALELGCSRICATGAARGQAGGLEVIAKVLEQIIPFAESNGILICLENHARNNLENIEDYERLFQMVDSPSLGVCADTGHFEAASVPLDEVADRLHAKINHIHVKEAASVGEERFVRFGDGVTDNVRFVERMIGYGYSGYITVELALEDKSTVEKDLKVPIDLFSPYLK